MTKYVDREDDVLAYYDSVDAAAKAYADFYCPSGSQERWTELWNEGRGRVKQSQKRPGKVYISYPK